MTRSWHAPRGAWACWAVALVLTGQALGADSCRVTIQGDGQKLGETPLIVETKQGISPGSYLLERPTGPSGPVAQVFEDRGKTFVAMILDQVPASDTLTYELDPGRPLARATSGVELIPRDRRIDVLAGGKLVTSYIPDDGPKPYFFPLIGPSGAAMTRSFPMKMVAGEKLDHPHHRSLWFTHGSVNKVDFWSEVPGHGKILETSRPTVVSGPALGLIRTTDDWIGPDGKKVCEDERVVRIFATKLARVLDFDIALKASEGPVTFGDTKEGMFGLRVVSSMDVTAKKGGKIVNAEGVEDKPTWGKPSPWVDYTGPVDGKTVGVALLNHPSSFRSPTTWHVRDYGLFAANPFGWHDFGQKESGEYVLPKGESIRFRYRIILHDGDTASAALPSLFRAYENPPKASID